MAFESMYLEEDIHIDRIYTIHYFEYKSDFHFAGERHNFFSSVGFLNLCLFLFSLFLVFVDFQQLFLLVVLILSFLHK